MEVANSERLRYRLLTEEDGQLLFELDQDVEVMRYINGGHMTTMTEINEKFIPRLNAYLNPEKGWGLWGVFTEKDNRYLGWVLVRPMDYFSDSPEYKNLELGWRFKRESWGLGYATEAAKQIKKALIENGDVETFSAIAVLENVGSINIMTKLGMEFVKQYIHQDNQLGDMDVVYYQCDAI